MGKKFASGVYEGQGSGGGGSNDLAVDLVALWEFDEASGTLAYDGKRHNDLRHTGTLANQTGIVGKCIEFGNTDSTNSVRTDLPDYWFNYKTQSYSIAFWYKTSDPDPSNVNPYILYYRRGVVGDGYPFALLMGGPSNLFSFLLYDGSTILVKDDVSVNTNNNWHHICFIVDSAADEVTVYHDGSLSGAAESFSTFGNLPTYQTQDLQMGYSVVSRSLNTLIDQLAIWKKALSSSEISALYNSGSGLASSSWTGGPTCATVSVTESAQCEYSSSITGTCSSPSYQWQYFETTPCGCWKDIVGATSSNYVDTVGYAQLRLRVACTTQDCWVDSGSVTPNCDCDLTVTISETSCVVSHSVSGTCTTPSYQWEVSDGIGGWDAILGETGSSYTSTADETVRLKLTCVGAVSGSCIYFSNSLALSCGPSAVCTTFYISAQTNNSSQACAASALLLAYVDMAGSIPVVGDIVYTVDGCSSPLDGNNKWWKLDDGLGKTYAVQVANNTGVIDSIVTC